MLRKSASCFFTSSSSLKNPFVGGVGAGKFANSAPPPPPLFSASNQSHAASQQQSAFASSSSAPPPQGFQQQRPPHRNTTFNNNNYNHNKNHFNAARGGNNSSGNANTTMTASKVTKCGIVKSFDQNRGFGYVTEAILMPQSTQFNQTPVHSPPRDFFFHYRDLVGGRPVPNYRIGSSNGAGKIGVHVGTRVLFDLHHDRGGGKNAGFKMSAASNVRSLDGGPLPPFFPESAARWDPETITHKTR